MSEVFELRQYTLHPGRRDDLIELFERELILPQEAAGMRLVGTFRDLDDPDRFVWFRSFPDMVRRKEALTEFYGGPIWKAHRNAANETMIDSDDVLLLRLVDPRRGFPDRLSSPVLDVTIHYLNGPIDDAKLPSSQPLLRTEPAENTYPALPVRSDEFVVVSLSSVEIAELANEFKRPPQHLRLEPTAKSHLR